MLLMHLYPKQTPGDFLIMLPKAIEFAQLGIWPSLKINVQFQMSTSLDYIGW